MPSLTISFDFTTPALTISLNVTLPQLRIIMPTLQELLTASRDLLAAVTADEDADDAEIAQLKADLATAKANAADPAVVQEITDNIAAAVAKMHPPITPEPPAPPNLP